LYFLGRLIKLHETFRVHKKADEQGRPEGKKKETVRRPPGFPESGLADGESKRYDRNELPPVGYPAAGASNRQDGMQAGFRADHSRGSTA
jgi:hypothetical protein